jgi:hypothetical protein
MRHRRWVGGTKVSAPREVLGSGPIRPPRVAYNPLPGFEGTAAECLKENGPVMSRAV